MSDSLHTPHKHDHDHDHGPKKLTPVHDHGHGGSCCSGALASALVQLSEKTSADARLSSFRIEAMDCPTEQTLIEERLGKLAGIERLEFNLINRILGVWHRLPSTTPIEAAISALGMQAEPLTGEAKPAQQPRIHLARPCRAGVQAALANPGACLAIDQPR